MSLVNQMLRDLEKQKQPGNQLDLHAVATNSSSLTKLTIALFVSVLVLGTIWWLDEDTGSATAQVSMDAHKPRTPEQAPAKSIPKTHSLSVTSETQPLSSHKVTQTPPKELVTANKKIVSTSLDSSQQSTNIRQNSLPTKSSNMKPGNLGSGAKDSGAIDTEAVDVAVDKPNPKLGDALITSDKSRQNNSPEKSVTSTQVKQKTLTSQLNRQLQQILAAQERVGIKQTIVQLEDLVKRNPQFEKAHLSLIKLAWQTEDDALEDTLLFAIQQNPEQPAFRIAAARYYLQQKNYSRAESIIQAESGNTPISPSLLQVRALIYQKQNKHQLAVNDYALLLKQTKKKAGIYLALAISLEALGKVDKAEQSYRNALRENQLNSRQTEFVRNKLLYLKG